MRNHRMLLKWSIAFSLFSRTAGASLLSTPTLRGTSGDAEMDDDLMLRSDMTEDGEQTMIDVADGQDQLLSGEFIKLFQEALIGERDHGRALVAAGNVVNSAVALTTAAASASSELDIMNPLNETCVVEESTIHYFDIEIEMTASADANPFDCQEADTIMLGHDINRMLWDYGVGAQNVFDDLVFLAGICPVPETPVERERRALYELKPTKFVYAGLGACKYCSGDNQDRRLAVTVTWFVEVFKPQLEKALMIAIQNDLVPTYANCLGKLPDIKVNVIGKELSDLENICGTENTEMSTDMIGLLPTYNLATVLLNPITHTNCSRCVNLDWSTKGNGEPVQRGDYVKDEWLAEYGVKVSARGGYTPNRMARVFDTSIVTEFHDQDLGSPNENCPQGGPGSGSGGVVGSAGVNCFPVGNVLIVQEQIKASSNIVVGTVGTENPQASGGLGLLSFTFVEPVMFSDLGFMDADELDPHRITIHYWDGLQEKFTFEGYGDNGVQRVVTNKENVRQVDVMFTGTAAVTEINFCPPCH